MKIIIGDIDILPNIPYGLTIINIIAHYNNFSINKKKIKYINNPIRKVKYELIFDNNMSYSILPNTKLWIVKSKIHEIKIQT